MAGRGRNLKQSSPISSPDKHYPTIKPCQSLQAATTTERQPLKCQQQFLKPPQPTAHLTKWGFSGILGAGPGRVALVLLVAPHGVTSTKACAPRPDGYF